MSFYSQYVANSFMRCMNRIKSCFVLIQKQIELEEKMPSGTIRILSLKYILKKHILALDISIHLVKVF